LARLQSNGTLDPTFTPGAVTRIAAAPVIDSIVQDEDGKLIVAGLFDAIGSVARHNVARLNGDGSVDRTFEPGAGPNDRVRTLALQRDGKPLLGGDFATVDNNPRNAAARLFGDTTPPFRSSASVAIPDQNGAGADASINVSGVGSRLRNVQVRVHVKHARVSDLTLRLIGPDGTLVDLAAKRGGSGDDFGADCPADENDTVFDDAAAVAISATSASAPFVGRFRPDGALAAFKGKTGDAANGTWKLRVIDDVAGEVGSIECWSLQLTTGPSITAFSPPSGLPGTRVTIKGSSFTGATAVRFNNTMAALSKTAVMSDTEIVTEVPDDATSGFISVSTSVGEGGSLAPFIVLTDSDNDGMSDDFEQLYFGNPLSGNPSADADGDGESNLDEYLAGTNPLDSRDALRITAIRRQGSDVVIVFPTVAHKTYRLEASETNSGQFEIPLATIPAYDTNTVLEVTDPGAAARPKRFYRVLLLP
jgi:subtilisin-like proprotein convertase family protein